MSEMQKQQRPGSGEAPLASVVVPDDLPGWLHKTVDVPANGTGLALRADQPAQRLDANQRHVVGGLLARTRAEEVAVIEAEEFAVHPTLYELLSGDGELLEADFLVSLRVTGPERFYSSLVRGRRELFADDLANLMASHVRGSLETAVREYAAADLCGQRAVTDRLAGQLRGWLDTYLDQSGLEVVGVRCLAFRRMADAVARADRLRELREQLRSVEMQDRVSQVEDALELRQLMAELGAGDLFAPGELEGWLSEPEPGSQAPAEVDARRLEQVLDEKLAGVEKRLGNRLEQLLLKLGYAEPKVRDIGRWWARLVTALRLLGALIVAGVTIVSIVQPDYFRDDRFPGLITTGVSLIIALLAFVSAFWIKTTVRQRREAALVARRRKLNRERRVAADRLLRDQIGREVDKVVSMLKQARDRAYAQGGKGLAVALREFEGKIEAFRREVQVADYSGSPYFSRERVADEQVQAMLDYDDGLLRDVRALADGGRSLYESVTEARFETGEDQARKLDLALLDARNRFADRAGLLHGINGQ